MSFALAFSTLRDALWANEKTEAGKECPGLNQCSPRNGHLREALSLKLRKPGHTKHQGVRRLSCPEDGCGFELAQQGSMGICVHKCAHDPFEPVICVRCMASTAFQTYLPKHMRPLTRSKTNRLVQMILLFNGKEVPYQSGPTRSRGY